MNITYGHNLTKITATRTEVRKLFEGLVKAYNVACDNPPGSTVDLTWDSDDLMKSASLKITITD